MYYSPPSHTIATAQSRPLPDVWPLCQCHHLKQERPRVRKPAPNQTSKSAHYTSAQYVVRNGRLGELLPSCTVLSGWRLMTHCAPTSCSQSSLPLHGHTCMCWCPDVCCVRGFVHIAPACLNIFTARLCPGHPQVCCDWFAATALHKTFHKTNSQPPAHIPPMRPHCTLHARF